jgi:glycerophosphoryl diester phosphodiesterase
MPQFQVIAHRGASGLAPENTLAAFRLAAELGAGFIETDLRGTRDGAIVALHDALLDRTTTGRGLLADRALRELRTLDAGSWFDPGFAAERVPTLDEILDWRRHSGLGLFLELKGEPGRGFLETLIGRLGSDRRGRIVILSFDPATLETLRALDSELVTGLLFDQPLPDPILAAREAGARELLPRHDLVDRDLIEQARGAGLPVVTWTVNDAARMRWLVSLGLDGMMTDRPDWLVAAAAGG